MKRVLVVIPHTHWDREWYRPFEAFRARLVHMMDSLLDLLDRDPEFKHFVMDGQTVPLDDYLEIRPDRRADVERLVKAGRLLIGPNYMLPDEFLIGGEAWVRNLQTGIRSARAYGGVMMVGYSPDAFGHIAHLPAILRGFGIDAVAIWRGVGREATTSEFRWASPDGSEVLALHFPYGYGMMAVLPEDRTALANILRSMRSMLEPLATTRYLLLPNGTDHLPAHQGLSQVIRTANEMLEDAQMVHGSYPMLVDAIKADLDGRLDKLPRLEGEFRSSQRSNILPGVLSARIWLKQRYQECEDLLARRAEPMAAWAHLIRTRNGDPTNWGKSDQGLLRHAWKLLLQNGPHDSVTGCSIDEVYEDVRRRFDHCQQIAEAVLYDSQHHIADLAAPTGGLHVAVFNSENGPRTDFCTVRLPVEDGKLPRRLVDGDGREVPLQVLQRGLRSYLESSERVVAGFVAPEVPAFGYRVLRVDYGEPFVPPERRDAVIENEYFRVTTDPDDGTLTVEDRRSGAALRGLNRFVDGGDRGDEYNYCPLARDELIDRPARPPEIRLTEAGPARHTLEVRLTFSLPSRLAEDRDGRSPERVECEIVTRASLYPGIGRIDIETEVDNRAEDHRLRVHFPSAIRSEYTYAEQHFGVVRRPVAVPLDDGTWMETPLGTHPQKSFVDVNDGARGFMLANRGLPEYEACPVRFADSDAALGEPSRRVLEGEDGTITLALTLLRCVGWLSRSDIRTRRGPAGPSLPTPGAQMLGRWTFHYSLIPHAGGWENGRTASGLPPFLEAHRFLRPLQAVRTARGGGVLPPVASLADIEPQGVILSSLKLAEDDDSIALRAYNISSAPALGRIRLNEPHGAVQIVNLNEEPLGPADVRNGWVEAALRPNQIATLKFAPA